MSAVQASLEGALGGFRLKAEFELPAGAFTALSGPSGSGKSTLIRCLAGLVRLPGRLVVDGVPWQDSRTFLRPHQRSVGLVFQEPSLLPHLSVRGNLDYALRRASAAPGPGLDEVVELLGLAQLLPRSPRHLSGGERQRVALGRALLSRPSLLLMDEPLSSLDADSKAEILPYLERLHRAWATPVLYVSHDPQEIARLADRVLLIREGSIVDTRAGPGAEAAERLAGLDPDARDRLALAALQAGFQP